MVVAAGESDGPVPYARRRAPDRIAIITAITGGYEARLIPIPRQRTPFDAVAFLPELNDSVEVIDGWSVDSAPYHLLFPHPMGVSGCRNSYTNNTSPLALAKYFKQQFHRIPRMRGYDVIIWVDAAAEITSPDFVRTVVAELVQCGGAMLLWDHGGAGGSLLHEVKAVAGNPKYVPYDRAGIPAQDVRGQYEAYVGGGYRDGGYADAGFGGRTGVFAGGVAAWNMRDARTVRFLDAWYEEVLRYTVQDQISLAFLVWKLRVRPCVRWSKWPGGAWTGRNPFRWVAEPGIRFWVHGAKGFRRSAK